MTEPLDRTTSLEIALTHQEVTIEDLNAAIVQQNGRIEILERQVKSLLQRVATAEADFPGGVVLADGPPPHW